MSELSGSLTLWFLKLSLKGYHTEEYSFDEAVGWVSSENRVFQFKDFSSSVKIDSEKYVFWKNRVNFDYELSSSLNFDLVEFTSSSSNFTFSFGFNLEIYEFLTLKFKTVSENKVPYRYIPAWADMVGAPVLNIFTDLLKSFNFFNVQDRYDSNFNLKSISLGLTHDLHDWDLNIDYTGKPYLNETASVPVWEWENKVSIFLKWKAVKDIKTEVEIDKGDVSF